MDIVEKETIKEVPVEYWQKSYGCNPCNSYSFGSNWNRPFIPASRGVATGGLVTGIIGTVLGAAALAKNGGLGGLNLFGGVSTPENVNINTLGTSGTTWGAPSVFDVLAKENQDVFNAQKALYDYALLDQNQDKIDEVMKREKDINKLQKLITEYLIKIENSPLSEKEHQVVQNMFYSIGDIERIGDHVENIAELAEIYTRDYLMFSDTARQELHR